MKTFKKERVWVLGSGFVGNCFRRNGFTVWNRSSFDYPNNVIKLEQVLEDNQVDVLINCVGISNTRWCEDPKNWEIVERVNGKLPNDLSKICKKYGKKLVHISTGCLYSCKDGHVTEEMFLSANCRYAMSKWIGECGCDPSCDIILRPRLLFDSVKVTDKRNNLIQKFEEFSEYLNEFNTITSNQTIVDTTVALLDNGCTGVYNCGCTGAYTIKEMAESLGFECVATLQDHDLWKKTGLHLINNVMSMDKLMTDSGYVPPDALDELKKCKKIMDNQKTI